MLKELEHLEKWVHLDIIDEEIKDFLLKQIECDKEKIEFDYNFYYQYFDCFSECGKTCLQCLKTSSLLKKMKKSVYTVIAVNKFKRKMN